MQAKAICLLASQVAKGGPGMVAIAGQWLNIVLENLKFKYNLQMNRVTVPITVQAAAYGPFPLEADYLRTYDLFYQMPASGGATQSSVTIFLNPVTMEQFDAEFKSPSISNYPFEFANDLSTDAQVWSGGSQGAGTKLSSGNMFIYPQSSAQLTLTHRYMKDQPDIASPQSATAAPWFPYTDYLVEATAAGLMGVTGDSRKPEYEASALDKLRPYLIQEGDEQQTVHSVRLDPRRFRLHTGLRPTKAMPF